MIRILLVSMLAAVGAASAQTTGTLAPSSDNAAPGDCMPIGVTASGEVVFPLTCHAFLEQRRGPIDKPVGATAEKAESPATSPAHTSVLGKKGPVIRSPETTSASNIDHQQQADASKKRARRASERLREMAPLR